MVPIQWWRVCYQKHGVTELDSCTASCRYQLTAALQKNILVARDKSCIILVAYGCFHWGKRQDARQDIFLSHNPLHHCKGIWM